MTGLMDLISINFGFRMLHRPIVIFQYKGIWSFICSKIRSYHPRIAAKLSTYAPASRFT